MKVLIFTGAGISADSGIPTYESKKWWKPELFEKSQTFNPELFYHLNEFREYYKEIKPCETHNKIREIQKKFTNTKVYTQNVDLLLEEAGCENVVHLHGKINEIKCDKCGKIETIKDMFYGKSCECGGDFRNNIVMYGEKGNYEEIIDDLIDLTEDDIVIILGTRCEMFHIDWFLKNRKCIKILNNLTQTTNLKDEDFDFCFYESCESALPKIINMLQVISNL